MWFESLSWLVNYRSEIFKTPFPFSNNYVIYVSSLSLAINFEIADNINEKLVITTSEIINKIDINEK